MTLGNKISKLRKEKIKREYEVPHIFKVQCRWGRVGQTVFEFIDTYLVNEKAEENYRTKHKTCDFLEENGVCKLSECKPESCEKFPYTNQPGRLESLYSVLDAVEVCPVAFEIFERLKQEYHFRESN
jgi:hypothetical protein